MGNSCACPTSNKEDEEFNYPLSMKQGQYGGPDEHHELVGHDPFTAGQAKQIF